MIDNYSDNEIRVLCTINNSKLTEWTKDDLKSGIYLHAIAEIESLIDSGILTISSMEMTGNRYKLTTAGTQLMHDFGQAINDAHNTIVFSEDTDSSTDA